MRLAEKGVIRVKKRKWLWPVCTVLVFLVLVGAYAVVKLQDGRADDAPAVQLSGLDGHMVREYPFDIYTYDGSPELMSPSIHLSQEDDTCQFTYSLLSSYLGVGRYELIDAVLTIRTDDGQNVWIFAVTEEGFVFDEASSSRIPRYRKSGDSPETYTPVPDGALFRRITAAPMDE